MRNFDLNRLPEDGEDQIPPAEENGNGFQQNLNVGIDLNELPRPEIMDLNELLRPETNPLSLSVLETLYIFTAIYFPLVLRR